MKIVQPPRLHNVHITRMRDELHRLLVDVNSGETLAFAFVAVRRGGIVRTVTCSNNEFYHQLNSGAARLSHQLATMTDDDDDDDTA